MAPRASKKPQAIKGLKTLIGWRATPALKARFEAFLAEQPPINQTEFLEAALTFYLDHAEEGYDPRTLRPVPPIKKGRS